MCVISHGQHLSLIMAMHISHFTMWLESDMAHLASRGLVVFTNSSLTVCWVMLRVVLRDNRRRCSLSIIHCLWYFSAGGGSRTVESGFVGSCANVIFYLFVCEKTQCAGIVFTLFLLRRLLPCICLCFNTHSTSLLSICCCISVSDLLIVRFER
jgi:hypothetical protein